MNDIFQDLIIEGHVCVYLDDILIFMKTLAEHQRILRLVLEHLRLHRLYLCPEKCEFKRTRIEYMGLIVSQGNVEMDPVKVAGVMDWPVPKNRKEVQVFLGFANFYRRFIEGFSYHAQPLFELMKKDLNGLGTLVSPSDSELSSRRPSSMSWDASSVLFRSKGSYIPAFSLGKLTLILAA
jgi:Reverse transcriptase (RNA-dependent DNA polymerase)